MENSAWLGLVPPGAHKLQKSSWVDLEDFAFSAKMTRLARFKFVTERSQIAGGGKSGVRKHLEPIPAALGFNFKKFWPPARKPKT